MNDPTSPDMIRFRDAAMTAMPFKPSTPQEFDTTETTAAGVMKAAAALLVAAGFKNARHAPNPGGRGSLVIVLRHGRPAVMASWAGAAAFLTVSVPAPDGMSTTDTPTPIRYDRMTGGWVGRLRDEAGSPPRFEDAHVTLAIEVLRAMAPALSML